MAVDEGSSAGLGMIRATNLGSSSSIPIDSSNIGFQLLKKQGWKEGTGLGVSEQGRLEPIETTVKKNKRGLGAEKPKKAIKELKDDDNEDLKGIILVRLPGVTNVKLFSLSRCHGTGNKFKHLRKTKVKGVSKKIRKIQEVEQQMQEKEFDRDFFRMFWPDNV